MLIVLVMEVAGQSLPDGRDGSAGEGTGVASGGRLREDASEKEIYISILFIYIIHIYLYI